MKGGLGCHEGDQLSRSRQSESTFYVQKEAGGRGKGGKGERGKGEGGYVCSDRGL